MGPPAARFDDEGRAERLFDRLPLFAPPRLWATSVGLVDGSGEVGGEGPGDDGADGGCRQRGMVILPMSLAGSLSARLVLRLAPGELPRRDGFPELPARGRLRAGEALLSLSDVCTVVLLAASPCSVVATSPPADAPYGDRFSCPLLA